MWKHFLYNQFKFFSVKSRALNFCSPDFVTGVHFYIQQSHIILIPCPPDFLTILLHIFLIEFLFPNCFYILLGKAKKPLVFHSQNYIMETPIPFQICFSFD